MIASWGLWVCLLLVAAGLRLTHPDWDSGIAAHPDERYLLGVAAQVPLYGDICAVAPDFPYGHLPVTLARLLVLTAPHADPLYTARLISGLVGVIIVAIAGACGQWVAGRRAGLLSGTLAAFAPFLVQQAHFFTVDPLATACVSGAVLAVCRRKWRMSGALLGLAIACKVSTVLAIAPLVTTAYWAISPAKGPTAWHRVGRVVGIAVLTFVLASPWPLLSPAACWRGPIVQSLMASGRFDFPYTRQYEGTLPYVYPLTQMALWGLGPTATLFGVLGLVVAAIRTASWKSLPAKAGWLWPVLFFVATGGLYVKFPRYLLPLYPWWSAWAALAALTVWHRRWWQGAAMVIVVAAPTVSLGLAQVNLYHHVHPWIEASEWIYKNVAVGGIVGIEEWDHPLPVPLPAQEPDAYTQITLSTLGVESAAKARALSQARAEASLIVLASRRGYGALARQPVRHAATLAWYRSLFLTRTVVIYTRCPRIGPVALTDDPLADAGLPEPRTLASRCGTRYALRLPRLDESFRVYDAPLVVLLKARP